MTPIKQSFLFIAFINKNYVLKCIENQANPTEAHWSWISVIYSLLAMANVTWTALNHAIARLVKHSPWTQHAYLLFTKANIMLEAPLKTVHWLLAKHIQHLRYALFIAHNGIKEIAFLRKFCKSAMKQHSPFGIIVIWLSNHEVSQVVFLTRPHIRRLCCVPDST